MAPFVFWNYVVRTILLNVIGKSRLRNDFILFKSNILSTISTLKVVIDCYRNKILDGGEMEGKEVERIHKKKLVNK